MSEVDQRPGRRRSETRRGRGRPAVEARPRRDSGRVVRFGWLALLALSTVVLVVDRIVELPVIAGQLAAGTLITVLAWGLSVRTGGRALWAMLLAAGLAATAFVTDWQPLLAGAAVATAVLAGTLAVMATVPSPTFKLAIREVLLATLVAAIGAVGVAGVGAGDDVRVNTERFEYAALALGLLGSIVLVFRLGAGLHGIGRRGYFLAGGAVALLALALAYSEALAQWGSPELIEAVDTVQFWFVDNLRAVPHPIAALLGFPALTWGVFMRARRRQGWWVCAFGVAATASTSTRLIDPAVSLESTLLGLLYSLVVGLGLGYLAIRVEQSVSGTRGRRARRDEEAAAHRPEPGRMYALH